MQNDPAKPTSHSFCPYPGCIKRGARCKPCRFGQRDVWAEHAEKNAKRGRPRNQSLAMAKLLGEKRYIGSECSRCGCTERYVKNQGCVECSRARVVEGSRLRREAIAARAAAGTDEITSGSRDLSQHFGNSDNDLGGGWHRTQMNSQVDVDDDVGVSMGKDVCSVPPTTDVDGFIDESLTQMTCASSVPEPSQSSSDPELDALLGDAGPTLRYFYHPESGSVWAQPSSEPAPTDGLVEEISLAEFTKIKSELDSLDPFA